MLILFYRKRNKYKQTLKYMQDIIKKGVDHMKDISTIRRTVAIMANQLHKLGYTLSKAFKTA